MAPPGPKRSIPDCEVSSLPHRKLLFIAYHFPPFQGSTGATRTVAFSKYLKQYDWDVCVLTIQPSAYENTSSENESLIPQWVKVERAWGFDSRRSLAIRGKYPRLLGLPDRWQSWIVGGFVKGSRIIKSWKPDLIMTTYPIPSAHVIGYLLYRKFHLPWVAEFRDPMLQPNYPVNTWERKAFAKIEQLAFTYAEEVVVTTGGCKQMYLDRFPITSKISMISNGYDPEMFAEIPSTPGATSSDGLVLLHSGLLYPHERNPTPFFNAIQSLSQSGFLADIKVEFHFRASGNEEDYLQTVKRLGIDSWVRILPRIPYAKALEEMTNADALMLFQADNCNDQIPAKTYEYMYCRKPILAFTSPAGDTAKLLSSVGVRNIAKLEDSAAIEKELQVFLRQLQIGKAFIVSNDDVRRFSRKALTGDLSRVLTRALSSTKRA